MCFWQPVYMYALLAGTELTVDSHGVRIALLIEPNLPNIGGPALRRRIDRAVGALVGYVGVYPVETTYIAVRGPRLRWQRHW
jgi:hypothetical protein